MYRQLARGLSFLIVALHFLWRATLLILWTMAMSTTSLIHGIPNTTRQAAETWKKNLVDMGLPDIYMNIYFHAARVMAVLFVLIGWVCFSFTTVYLVMLVVQ